jgi:type IX secretion system PorP/SprF family membrane protein
MKNLRYIISVSLLVAALSPVIGQQRPIQSLYMFDQMLINPAYAGVHVQLSATSIYRNQWVNLPGAPKTFTTSIHSGFLKNRMGLGLMVTSETIGVHENTNVYASYSYKIQLPYGGSLSMGLQAGFDYIRSDFSKTDPNSTASTFYQAFSNWNPNFGAGVFYTNRNFYAGLSVPYLLNGDLINAIEGVITLAQFSRNYLVTVGNTYQLNKDFKVIPSVLMRYEEGAPLSFDVSANLIIEETVGLGLSYRYFEGLVWMFELKVNENFHVGYAYDATTSALGLVSNGSHEIMVNYRIKIPRLHKGLDCPSYF